MDFLTRVDNAHVWLVSGGIFRQGDLYRRGEQLFAKWGSGFVRLTAYGATTAPKVSWREIDLGGEAHLFEIEEKKNPIYIGATKAPKKITKAA